MTTSPTAALLTPVRAILNCGLASFVTRSVLDAPVSEPLAKVTSITFWPSLAAVTSALRVVADSANCVASPAIFDTLFWTIFCTSYKSLNVVALIVFADFRISTKSLLMVVRVAVVQFATVPAVNAPPKLLPKPFEVFKSEYDCPSVKFEKALAICAAVAPLVPAVNVRSPRVSVWPADKDLNEVTTADSVTPAPPWVKVMVGVFEPVALKSVTLLFAVTLVKVIDAAALFNTEVNVAVWDKSSVAPPIIWPTKPLNTLAEAALSLPAVELKALVPLIITLATLAAAVWIVTSLLEIGLYDL